MYFTMRNRYTEIKFHIFKQSQIDLMHAQRYIVCNIKSCTSERTTDRTKRANNQKQRNKTKLVSVSHILENGTVHQVCLLLVEHCESQKLAKEEEKINKVSTIEIKSLNVKRRHLSQRLITESSEF